MKTTAETLITGRKALRAKFGMISRPVIRLDLIRKPEPTPEPVVAIDIQKARSHPAPTTPPRVLLAREVAAKHGITFEELFLPHRRRRYVHARREYYYRAAMELKHSYAQIGRFFGQDHTTVLHGVNTFAAENNLPHPSKE